MSSGQTSLVNSLRAATIVCRDYPSKVISITCEQCLAHNNILDCEGDDPINVGRGDPDVSSKQRRRNNMTYRAAEPKRREKQNTHQSPRRWVRRTASPGIELVFEGTLYHPQVTQQP